MRRDADHSPDEKRTEIEYGAYSEASSITSSIKAPRTPRFAEATSFNSPILPSGPNPFLEPANERRLRGKPSDIGFGYVGSTMADEIEARPQVPMTPLRSALKSPGMAPRKFDNPLSPTFREEDIVEKRETQTAKQQKRDLVGSLLVVAVVCLTKSVH
jgi:hypothetical protein